MGVRVGVGVGVSVEVGVEASVGVSVEVGVGVGGVGSGKGRTSIHSAVRVANAATASPRSSHALRLICSFLAYFSTPSLFRV